MLDHLLSHVVESWLAARRTAWVEARDGVAIVCYAATERLLPRSLVWCALALLVVALGFCVDAVLEPTNARFDMVISMVCGLFAVIFGALGVGYLVELRRTITISERGLDLLWPWSTRVEVVPWEAVRSVTLSWLGSTLILRWRGSSAALNPKLCGLGTLYAALVKRAPHVRISPRAAYRMQSAPE